MMVKLTYSSDINGAVGVGGEIVKSASELHKQASTIFGCEYEKLAPPSGYTGIHLVALGDAEAFPMNRNGDLFTKKACVEYHDTFVKCGHVFEHHRNKDPQKAIGMIKASAYNPDMHRVELYIWADNEKAHDHLERLEKTGSVAFSMACTVPKDRCSVCGATREHPGAPGECDHIKYSLGKIAEDGTQIGTYNDEPRWFDISFVGRPADRIAWNLKVASDMSENIPVVSSVKRAEMEGYVVPDGLAIESDSAKRKHGIMRKLAESYEKLSAWIDGSAKPQGRDAYLFELRKLAGASLDDGAISALREMEPSDAFAALGLCGVVMDAPSFFKYAFGPSYGAIEKYVLPVEKAVPRVVCDAVKAASCAEFCNFSLYDANPEGAPFSPRRAEVLEGLRKSASASGFGTHDPVTNVLAVMAEGACPDFAPMQKCASADEGVDSKVVDRLAKRYAMYKLAGLCAAFERGAVRSEDDVVFVAAAQDMRVCRS